MTETVGSAQWFALPHSELSLSLQDPLLPYDAVFHTHSDPPLPRPRHICRWLGHFSFGLGKRTFCAASPKRHELFL